MDSIKIHLFEALVDKEIFMIENEMAAIVEMSRTLLKRKEYDRYLKNADKLVQMSKNTDLLEEFKQEILGVVNPSGLNPPPPDSVSEEANYMEGLIKAVTDLANETPPQEPKKKEDGGLGNLKTAFDRYGSMPLNPLQGLNISEDGVISDSSW
jgi:hypothetical protein